jgi:hypothetical protein
MDHHLDCGGANVAQLTKRSHWMTEGKLTLAPTPTEATANHDGEADDKLHFASPL